MIQWEGRILVGNAGMNLDAKMDRARSVVPAVAAGKTGVKVDQTAKIKDMMALCATKDLIQSITVVCEGVKIEF